MSNTNKKKINYDKVYCTLKKNPTFHPQRDNKKKYEQENEKMDKIEKEEEEEDENEVGEEVTYNTAIEKIKKSRSKGYRCVIPDGELHVEGYIDSSNLAYQEKKHTKNIETICKTQVLLSHFFKKTNQDALNRTIAFNLKALSDDASCWCSKVKSLDKKTDTPFLVVNRIYEKSGGIPLLEWFDNLALEEEGGSYYFDYEKKMERCRILGTSLNLLLQAIGTIWGLHSIPPKFDLSGFRIKIKNEQIFLDGTHVTENSSAPLLIYEVAGLVYPIINSPILFKLNTNDGIEIEIENMEMENESEQHNADGSNLALLYTTYKLIVIFAKYLPCMHSFLKEKMAQFDNLDNGLIKDRKELREIVSIMIDEMNYSFEQYDYHMISQGVVPTKEQMQEKQYNTYKRSEINVQSDLSRLSNPNLDTSGSLIGGIISLFI